MKTQNPTIKLSKETKDLLALMGAKGDTYEQIILRLIKEHNDTHSTQTL